MTDSPDSWLDMGPTSYQADGGPAIKFPARSVGERGGLRIAPRARPWQRAEKLDSVGARSDTFSLECLFHPDVQEPDLGEWPPLWPDRLEQLIDAFKGGATGTLHLPWKRNLRVKPSEWERRATADEHRGGEILTVTFLEDNEDSIDREAVERVSAKATVESVVEAAVFDLESIGGWDGSVEDLQELASGVAGLLNAPGEYLDNLAVSARRLRATAQTLLAALSSAAPGRGQLDDPSGATARAKLLELLDLASSAEEEARASLPKTRSVVYSSARNIYAVAAELGQSARTLLTVNPQLEDPSYIEAGTPIWVLAE
jgi:prophage DNA circulation protein